MGILGLFVTASMPVLKVLLVTGVGSILAVDSVGILCADARNHLNNIVFYVFNPSLVSSNLSKTVTMESMVLLWFMPINILLTFVVGSGFGWCVIRITNAPKHLRGLILGCCAAGNLGNMLLIIVPAICKERGSPFGAPDACSTYGLAYASLSMAIGAIFLWSYVYNLVRISSSAPQDAEDADSPTNARKRTWNTESSRLIAGGLSDDTLPVKCTPLPGDECALILPNSPTEDTASKVSCLDRAVNLSLTVAKAIDLKKLFAPSTIGVIVGFAVGVVPEIRKALIGENAPLRVIQDSAYLLGEGAIPTLTLLMGGNLIKGLRGSDIRFTIVLGVVLVRYVMLPLAGILIIKGAAQLGLLHDDPLYRFILLLQYALPPALNIGTITQLFGAGESECSVIFLWAYALASVSLTLWSTFFMWFVSTG